MELPSGFLCTAEFEVLATVEDSKARHAQGTGAISLTSKVGSKVRKDGSCHL